MRSFQRINQEKKELEKKSTQLFFEFNNIYKDYLKLLGSTSNKQLILAVYQICTHIYPKLFLKLSNSQRKELQEKIKELCKSSEFQFLSYMTVPQPISSEVVVGEISKYLFPYKKDNIKQFQDKRKRLSFTNKLDKNDKDEDKIINPEDLIKWCRGIEQGIQITLNNFSQEINNRLKQNKIISNYSTSHLFEIGSKIEDKRFLSESYPNILNLLVEENASNKISELGGKNSKEPSVIKISTLHLKLSDIEFNDSELSFRRKKISQQTEKLNQVQKKYQKIKKEYIQAKAESEWNSNWCN